MRLQQSGFLITSIPSVVGLTSSLYMMSDIARSQIRWKSIVPGYLFSIMLLTFAFTLVGIYDIESAPWTITHLFGNTNLFDALPREYLLLVTPPKRPVVQIAIGFLDWLIAVGSILHEMQLQARERRILRGEVSNTN
jgi:hypothetical protein